MRAYFIVGMMFGVIGTAGCGPSSARLETINELTATSSCDISDRILVELEDSISQQTLSSLWQNDIFPSMKQSLAKWDNISLSPDDIPEGLKGSFKDSPVYTILDGGEKEIAGYLSGSFVLQNFEFSGLGTLEDKGIVFADSCSEPKLQIGFDRIAAKATASVSLCYDFPKIGQKCISNVPTLEIELTNINMTTTAVIGTDGIVTFKDSSVALESDFSAARSRFGFLAETMINLIWKIPGVSDAVDNFQLEIVSGLNDALIDGLQELMNSFVCDEECRSLIRTKGAE